MRWCYGTNAIHRQIAIGWIRLSNVSFLSNAYIKQNRHAINLWSKCVSNSKRFASFFYSIDLISTLFTETKQKQTNPTHKTRNKRSCLTIKCSGTFVWNEMVKKLGNNEGDTMIREENVPIVSLIMLRSIDNRSKSDKINALLVCTLSACFPVCVCARAYGRNLFLIRHSGGKKQTPMGSKLCCAWKNADSWSK